MNDQKLDFRGKLLFDSSYSYKSRFVEQLPLSDMLPELEEVFAKGILAIKWHQYIPSFNDGEPCEFSIGDVRITNNPAVVAEWVNDQMFDEDEYDENYIESFREHADGEIGRILTPVGDSKFEYALRAEFGDNVEVVITPEATYQFDYDCGY